MTFEQKLSGTSGSSFADPKVTAESLIDCLASEQFFSLLSAPDKKENRKKLQLMCESFLKAFFESKEKNIYQKLPDVVSRVSGDVPTLLQCMCCTPAPTTRPCRFRFCRCC